MKHYKSPGRWNFALDPTGGAYCSAPQTPSWWGGEKTATSGPLIRALLFGPSYLAISMDPHSVVDGLAPMAVHSVVWNCWQGM